MEVKIGTIDPLNYKLIDAFNEPNEAQIKSLYGLALVHFLLRNLPSTYNAIFLLLLLFTLFCNLLSCDHLLQYLQTISSRQMDMQKFIADGCREALLEEKRRFCFLADKHCMFSCQISNFYENVSKDGDEQPAQSHHPFYNGSFNLLSFSGASRPKKYCR